jgi:hypothetical protein
MALLREAGEYRNFEAVPDLAGIPRVCIAWLGGIKNPR